MNISIIIPTYNEAENIGKIVPYLLSVAEKDKVQIIVADAGSEDDTVKLALAHGALAVISPIKGRAGQMNHGVTYASGDVLYFIHADSRPPLSYFKDIENAIARGYNCGCYRSRFDSNKFLLKVNAFFTRLNVLFCRGGDQTIFVTKQLFEKVGTLQKRNAHYGGLRFFGKNKTGWKI